MSADSPVHIAFSAARSRFAWLARVQNYVALTRPRVLTLVLFTAPPAMVLGHEDWPSTAMIFGIILGAALIVAVVRSGFLYRSSPARAMALEGGLLLSGLLFARALASPTSLGVGLGVWAFFLCQSLFFVAGGVRERAAAEPEVDPFVGARRKALALLEEL